MRPDNLDALPFADTADQDPDALPFGDEMSDEEAQARADVARAEWIEQEWLEASEHPSSWRQP
jgi:hypothetical protein